jgi:DNA-binding GntR family transcriptional regulator
VTKSAGICEALVQQIEAGLLKEGDRLPSEAQLAADFGVSLGTIQKSLARLAQSGLISREHGRGTFVSGSTVDPAGVDYMRFRDASGRELPHFIHVKSVKRMTRKGPWTELLGDDAACVRIVRNINVGGRLDLHSEFWMRETDFQRLDRVDNRFLAKNLRLLIGQKLSMPTLRMDQWIRFERVSDAICGEIGIAGDMPAFVMEMRGYSVRDHPIFYQRLYAGPFSERLIIVR